MAFCEQCGTQLDAFAAFCGGCGTAVRARGYAAGSVAASISTRPNTGKSSTATNRSGIPADTDRRSFRIVGNMAAAFRCD